MTRIRTAALLLICALAPLALPGSAQADGGDNVCAHCWVDGRG